MAWEYIEIQYPTVAVLEKILIWADKDFNAYFALKKEYTADWIYLGGDASHNLSSGKKLVSYGTNEGSAQTNYVTLSPNSSGKVLCVLPSPAHTKYIRMYVQTGAGVTIREFRPSTIISAHEIITGELEITDELSDAPLIRVVSGGTDRLKIGKIGTDYGIKGYDASGNLVFEISTNQNTIAGWEINQDKLVLGTSDIVLDATNKSITINDSTFGNKGIQLEYNNGTPRFYVGDGSGQYLKFDGTDVSIGGEINATTGSIGGWSIGTTTLSSGTDDIVLDAGNKKIYINSKTYGSLGIQLEYNSGTPRFHVGGETSQYFRFDGSNISWKGTNTELTTAGEFTASNANITGTITTSNLTADGGSIGGWSISSTKLYTTGIDIDSSNQRVKVYNGDNYVEMSPSGLIGYDSTLGITFNLPTDGSAPEFSSGVIKECEYQIYTSGVIKTDSDPATNGGLLINNTSLTGYNTSGEIRFQVIYGGADQGDVLIGDYSNNKGIFWDQSAGTLTIKGLMSAGVIQSSNWGASSGMQLDLDNATFTVRESNGFVIESSSGLVVNSGAGIAINNGGQLTLSGDSTNPATIYFDGSSYYTRMATTTDGGDLYIWPNTEGGVFGVGKEISGGSVAVKRFQQAGIYTQDYFEAHLNSGLFYSQIVSNIDATYGPYLTLRTYDDDSGKELKIYFDNYNQNLDVIGGTLVSVTTQELRLLYDASNYVKFLVDSSGDLTITPNSLVTVNSANLTVQNDSTSQLTVSYDADTAVEVQVNSDGKCTISHVGDFTNSSFLFNETSNSYCTAGVTINQGANDDEILSLKSSDVSHSYSSTESDTFGLFTKYDATAGGLKVYGVSESDVGLSVGGWAPNYDDTTATTSLAKVLIQCDGATSGSSNILAVVDGNGNTRFIFKETGYLYLDGGTGTYDTYNDLALTSDINKIFNNIVIPNLSTLERLDLIKYDKNSDHIFINQTNMTKLFLGAFSQLYKVIDKLCKKLNIDFETAIREDF